MADIINLSMAREARMRHLRGPARCLSCRHEWEAVTPEGCIASLECPACALFTGVLQGVSQPENGVCFVCNCGCDLYYILPDGLQCLRCGVCPEGW